MYTCTSRNFLVWQGECQGIGQYWEGYGGEAALGGKKEGEEGAEKGMMRTRGGGELLVAVQK